MAAWEAKGGSRDLERMASGFWDDGTTWMFEQLGARWPHRQSGRARSMALKMRSSVAGLAAGSTMLSCEVAGNSWNSASNPAAFIASSVPGPITDTDRRHRWP